MGKKKKRSDVSEPSVIVESAPNDVAYKCPACGNNKKVYEQGIAEVKVTLLVCKGFLQEDYAEVIRFIKNPKTICAECGTEIDINKNIEKYGKVEKII